MKESNKKTEMEQKSMSFEASDVEVNETVNIILKKTNVKLNVRKQKISSHLY